MKQLALLAALPCIGMMALCQSAALPGTAQSSSSKPPETLFNFSGGQLGQFAPVEKSRNTISCDGKSTNLSSSAGRDDFFRAPCMDASKIAELALISPAASPLMPGQGPKGKAEPIPTQWPNAKAKPIPTTWPKLKLEQVEGQAPSPKPAK